MAEVSRRSFDLNSSTGLTDLLQYARKSTLSPLEYAAFRDMVLQHAQLKGSDQELKKKIETIMNTLVFKDEKETVSRTNPHSEENKETSLSSVHVMSQGRRTVPSFHASSQTKSLPIKDNEVESTKNIPPPPSVPEPVAVRVAESQAPEEPAHEAEPAPSSVVPVEVPPPVELKSIEEHKARILEIKRHVNELVGNPATLMDHGNEMGREYMKALLNALKATSPGSTQNVETAMSTLEEAFKKIIEHGGKGEEPKESIIEEAKVEEAETIPPPLQPEATESNEPEIFNEENNEPEPSVEELVTRDPEPESEEPKPQEEVMERTFDPVPDIEKTEATPLQAIREPEPQFETEEEAEETREMLKERLQALEEEEKKAAMDIKRIERKLPSILDMEATPLPKVSPVSATHAEHMTRRELTERPISSFRSNTGGTSQAELVTPEVTAILTRMLHDWNIFSSSGLFGMGPSGIEHPLYEKLSSLPMGEVLSGRFRGADMKIVHAIKDYVDAWRHEQGVAYNPSETFEHYLRRVAQRIMKRQNGTEAV